MQVRLSDRAQARIHRLGRERGCPTSPVRLFVAPGSGRTVDVGLSFDEPGSGDTVVACGAVQLIVDSESGALLDSISIDYDESPDRRGFTLSKNAVAQPAVLPNSN